MSNKEYYCPAGFVFLTNSGYGNREWETEDNTLRYQNTIKALQNAGYIIQVAEPFTLNDKPFSQPAYLYLAIYIKRADGNAVDLVHAHNIVLQSLYVPI